MKRAIARMLVAALLLTTLMGALGGGSAEAGAFKCPVKNPVFICYKRDKPGYIVFVNHVPSSAAVAAWVYASKDIGAGSSAGTSPIFFVYADCNPSRNKYDLYLQQGNNLVSFRTGIRC